MFVEIMYSRVRVKWDECGVEWSAGCRVVSDGKLN